MRTIKEMYIKEKERKDALARITAISLGKELSKRLSSISYSRDYDFIVGKLIDEGQITVKEVIIDTSELPNEFAEIVQDGQLKTFVEFELRKSLEEKLGSLLDNDISAEGLELSVEVSLCSHGQVVIGWKLFIDPLPFLPSVPLGAWHNGKKISLSQEQGKL